MALYQLIDKDGTVDRMTFTAAGKSGRIGPTLAECRNYYGTSSSSWWNNSNNYLNMTETGVQQWTVPATGIYEITAKGASGGHGGGTSGTGAQVAKFVGDSDGLLIQNVGAGDYGIYNTAQVNGFEI